MEHYEEYDAAWEAAEGYEEDGAEVMHDQRATEPERLPWASGRSSSMPRTNPPASEAKRKKILDSTGW